jgi:predicted nucleic acid-binding protein
MGLIVDTCVLIRVEKNNQTIDFSRWEKFESVYISTITVSELIGAYDLIIAATALAYDCSLLTENNREFDRVPGLDVLRFKV